MYASLYCEAWIICICTGFYIFFFVYECTFHKEHRVIIMLHTRPWEPTIKFIVSLSSLLQPSPSPLFCVPWLERTLWLFSYVWIWRQIIRIGHVVTECCLLFSGSPCRFNCHLENWEMYGCCKAHITVNYSICTVSDLCTCNLTLFLGLVNQRWLCIHSSDLEPNE